MKQKISNWPIWGPLSRIGLSFAAFALVIDQLHKWWMIHIYRIAERGVVEVTPFLNFVMLWNPGISYGLFPQNSVWGKIGLIVFALIAVAFLVTWLARADTKISAISVGLVIGGALGNAIDRVIYGAVADFFSFHAFGYYWYVFNIADSAIVAGVIGLLYELFIKSRKKVSNAS